MNWTKLTNNIYKFCPRYGSLGILLFFKFSHFAIHLPQMTLYRPENIESLNSLLVNYDICQHFNVHVLQGRSSHMLASTTICIIYSSRYFDIMNYSFLAIPQTVLNSYITISHLCRFTYLSF